MKADAPHHVRIVPTIELPPTSEHDVTLDEPQQPQQPPPSGGGGLATRCVASAARLAHSPRWRRSCFRVGVLWALVALSFVLLPYVLRVNNRIHDEFFLSTARSISLKLRNCDLEFVAAAPGETVSVEPKKKRLTPMPNPSPN